MKTETKCDFCENESELEEVKIDDYEVVSLCKNCKIKLEEDVEY